MTNSQQTASTYTVKKFTTGQEIYRIKLGEAKSVVCMVTTKAPRFVVMENDKPFFAPHPILKEKKHLQMFPTKSFAQRQADYYNR